MKAEIQPFRRLNLTVSVWLEAFLIIIELSHKILWEEFRINTNHKVRPRVAKYKGKCIKTLTTMSTPDFSNPWLKSSRLRHPSTQTCIPGVSSPKDLYTITLKPATKYIPRQKRVGVESLNFNFA